MREFRLVENSFNSWTHIVVPSTNYGSGRLTSLDVQQEVDWLLAYPDELNEATLRFALEHHVKA